MKYLIKYKLFESSYCGEVEQHLNDIFLDVKDEGINHFIEVSVSHENDDDPIGIFISIEKIVEKHKIPSLRSYQTFGYFKWTDVDLSISSSKLYLESIGFELEYIEIYYKGGSKTYGIQSLKFEDIEDFKEIEKIYINYNTEKSI